MDKLAADMDVIKKSTQRLLYLAEKPQDKDDRARPLVTQDQLITCARGLHALELATDHDVTVYPELNVLVCSVCVPSFDPEQDLARGRVTGVFGFDMSLGQTFPAGQRVPAEFSQLKTSIKEHVRGRHHCSSKEAFTRSQREEEQRATAAGTIGARVARTAYSVLKGSMPQEMFEDLVVLQHLNGLDMGSMGHSAAQIPRFRAATHEVLLDELKSHVETQPCVSLISDKVTVNHRTIDITGVISVVPNAPPGHMLQTYVIGAPVVPKHDGASMAKEWVGTVSKIGIVTPDKLAAICTDGQYLHNGTPAKFVKALTAAQTDLSARSQTPAVPCLWDGAHLLELADGSARKQSQSDWVNDTVDTISRINRRFRTGAGREELIEEGKARGVPVRTPQLWSETRFAPHAAAVLEAFLVNMPVMASIMDRQVAWCRLRSVADELERDLRLLRGQTLRFRVSALLDVYTVLSDLSKGLQNIQKLPWERQEQLKLSLDQLDHMKQCLPRSSLPASKQLRDPAEIRRALEESTPEEFADSWPNLQKKGGSLSGMQEEVGEVYAFCEALVSHCTDRAKGNDAKGCSYGSDNAELAQCMADIQMVADLERLQSAKFSSVVVDIERASARLETRRIIPRSVRLESVRAAYDVLRTPSCDGKNNQQLLQQLYLARRENPSIQAYIDITVRLWLISPAESVVESMASVVKEVFGMHRNLNHENAAQELVIRWNGPDICVADPLIKAIVAKTRINHTRHHSVSGFPTGMVIRRHLNRLCARSRAYFGGMVQRAVRFLRKRV